MLSENPDTFFRFGLSIDAIGEKHDKIREIEGLFKMIEKTAENLNKLKSKYKNFYLISNTVFSQDTEDSIRETLNYIKKIYLLIKIKQHTLGVHQKIPEL